MADSYSNSNVSMLITSLGADSGLEVIDPIERRRRTLETREPIEPTPADPDQFRFPVETAVEVETSAIHLPVEGRVCVRDADARMLQEVGVNSQHEFPSATYSIEPAGIVKIHLRVESGLKVSSTDETIAIGFDDEVPVLVGTWSQHDESQAAVTTTDDPTDILRTISTFGSALTTTSPERAFPSYRGHPPTVEVGRELDIPDGLAARSDDVHVEVPPKLEYAYPIAPLSFYLGCPVRPGPVPRIVGDGIDHRLGDSRPFEEAVERTLKRIFLLDCVTRTEGIYQIDLRERSALESRLDLSYEDLYEASHSERLRRYLEIPHEALRDQIPDWQHAAQVEASVDSVEMLPYLTDDLAILQIADGEPVSGDALSSGATQGLVRGGTDTVDSSFIDPGDGPNAIDEAWVGSGTPIGATKAMPEAYENRLGRTPSTDDICITVVCNADEMAEEHDVVDEVYGTRYDLPFEITVKRNTSTAELAHILRQKQEFFHYIGHIEDRGFECQDGYLDTGDLDDIGLDAFFLNACQSYTQGRELIRSGAIGGIVTLSDVVNYGAVRIGKAVARLLNSGFPLRPALGIARDESVIGSQYAVVGDGGIAVVQPESGTPNIVVLRKRNEHFSIELDLYGAEPGIGGLFAPHIDDCNEYYLASGSTDQYDLSTEELIEYLQRENCPIEKNGSLTWAADFGIEDL